MRDFVCKQNPAFLYNKTEMQQVPQKIQKEARNTENFSVVFVLKSRHERDYKKITRQKYF